MVKSAASRRRLMRSPSWPHLAKPSFHARGLRGGELVGGQAFARRVPFVHPGTEVLGPQLGEGEQQVGQIALRIDDQSGDPVDRRLFEETDAQTGLAAARHPHTDTVRHQVFGIVQEEVLAKLTPTQVVLLAQVEDTQLLEIFHVDPFFATDCAVCASRAYDNMPARGRATWTHSAGGTQRGFRRHAGAERNLSLRDLARFFQRPSGNNWHGGSYRE